MKKNNLFLMLLAIYLLSACSPKSDLKNGQWRAELTTEGGALPFGLELTKNADSTTFTAIALNGNERLTLDTALFKNDSIVIPMAIFDAELIAKVNDNKMNGTYRKMRSDGSFLEGKFKAELGYNERFRGLSESKINVSGKWSTLFRGITKTTDTTLAVGIFEQKGANVTGTFMTPTGDYRYLAGSVSGDSLLLSCFDGNHTFLFKAKIDTATKTMNGQFFANLKLIENWSARLNPEASLPDAKTLTFLKPGYKTFDVSFPNTKGEQVSLKDARYQGKVTVVQIMGSWCPNCMDETKFLSKWYKTNRQRGVEVLALGFEKSRDLAISGPKLERLKKRFDVQYEVLLAGTNDKADASSTLPMLNRIASFPTTIIIDKKGIVREIQTGFSGPGTGIYYDNYVSDFNRLIDKLLAE